MASTTPEKVNYTVEAKTGLQASSEISSPTSDELQSPSSSSTKPKVPWYAYIWDYEPNRSKEESAFLHRLDTSVLIILSLGYFIKNLDQTNIANAYVSGMKEDLRMNQNQINYVDVAWTTGYVVGQIPSQIILTKVRPSIWIPSCEMVWTILTFCLAAAKTSEHVIAIRFFVGLFESIFYPAAHMILGSWYKPSELAKRACIFHASSAIASMFSGYLQAGVYKGLNGTHGLAGWQWLFIMDGIISAPIAIAGLFLIPDLPENSRAFYLRKDQIVLAQKRMESVGRAPRTKLGWSAWKRIFGRWHVYLLTILYIIFINTGPSSSINPFSLWLKESGYSVELINIIPTAQSAVQAVATIVIAIFSDYWRQRAAWMSVSTFFGLLYSIILAIWTVPSGLKWFAFFIYRMSVPYGPISMSWANEICGADAEERSIVLGLMNSFGYAFNAWLPLLTYPQVDAPVFRKGFIWSTSRRQENQALRDEVIRLRRLLEQSRANIEPHSSSLSTVTTASSRDFLDVLAASSQFAQPASLSSRASPSYQETVRASIPYTQSALEFELMCKHPNAYQILEPHGPSEAIANAILTFAESPFRSHTTGEASPPPRLRQKNALCDARLRDLEISYWTTAPVPNDTAASIISLYLETMHPVLGTFDAELFLGDLLHHKLRFCSPFLVNAVLYFGCQAYTVFDSDASRLAWQFYDEAMKLWEADKSTDSLLHVAALVNMTYAGSSNGHDNDSMKLLNVSRKMAARLGLEDSDPDSTPHTSETNSVSDDVRFRAHIAWGYFIHTCGYAFYYDHPPTKSTSSLPIPGSPGFKLPSYMGTTINHICKFWLLGREIVILYAGAPETAADRVPLAAMESKYQQLLALAGKFETDSSHATRVPHHTAILHVWYHTAIVTLMRPWSGRKVVLRTFDSTNSNPESISAASLRQLKRLIIEIRLHYSQATYNIHWHPGLLFIANAVLANSANDPEWQFYFMACLYGYGVLSTAFPVAGLCFKGLLALAVESGKMPASRARLLAQELSQHGEQHDPSKSYSGIQMNLDVGELKERPGTVEELASRLESTVLAGTDDAEVEDDAWFDDLINFG
ncbi:hypothetical protein CBER1_10276 [Cercospora berteroae]|uniref:Major facilitator superfamily (MFS) profile domain-containing protein n=1 Tax=Cercospora berteroae TaxID=357750 RepID=A0A2S6BXR0_9PEZI|nr:hypothetical protein CBER1_10276 [Cercospora berteroae]